MGDVIAFDIEIANVFELAPGEDLDSKGPFDISVAAATHEAGVWHWHSCGSDGRPTGCLDRALAFRVLSHLRSEQLKGSIVCAWNGMSFDVRWLGHAAGDMELAASVALDLFDPMFQFVASKGFPISLGAAADGMGLTEKKLMDGADAPKQWAAGNHQAVLDYVASDCRMTREVVTRILARHEVRWRTQKGQLRGCSMPRLERVRDVMRRSPPDQSWMDDPKPWASWFAWLVPFVKVGAP